VPPRSTTSHAREQGVLIGASQDARYGARPRRRPRPTGATHIPGPTETPKVPTERPGSSGPPTSPCRPLRNGLRHAKIGSCGSAAREAAANGGTG
jgi:hypothetical protein